MSNAKMVLTATVAVAGFAAFARPVWEDPDQGVEDAVVRTLGDGSRVRVDSVAADIFRVRRTRSQAWTESGMNRYGIIARTKADASSVTRRKAGFFGGIAALLLCALCFSFARVQYNQYINATDAIITRAVTSVKSSPDSGSAKDLFVLHAGSKVRILDSVGEWMNVELPDGRQGWLPEADMEVI